MDDESVDAIVTDPPYGLGKVKDVSALLKSWMDGDSGDEHVGSGGFMSKDWDKSVPSPVVWKEALRVLKPGGHLLVFAGTRTQDLMGISIRLAGAELRDEISYFGNISWIYGNGLPKGMNISKKIDQDAGVKREVVGNMSNVSGRAKSKGVSAGFHGDIVSGHCSDITAPATDDAKKFDGYGTAIKPAHEPILMFRKPLSEKTVAKNVLKHGTGGLNIDKCRIGTSPEDAEAMARCNTPGSGQMRGRDPVQTSRGQNGPDSSAKPLDTTKGRFPANVMFVHHEECECVGEKRVKGSSYKPSSVGKGSRKTDNPYCHMAAKITVSHVDEDGMETVEDWKCHPDCPVKLLDEQSGPCKSGNSSVSRSSGKERNGNTSAAYGAESRPVGTAMISHADIATGASRFFYCSKANKSERTCGGTVDNIHPTVKPVRLLKYLIRLVTPPGGVVLDPFCGSGSTIVAAIKEGVDVIGIEQSDEYVEIARKRAKSADDEVEQLNLL